MTQLQLFNSPELLPPLARRDDKPTSHQATTDFNLPLAQRRAHDAAKALLRSQPDVTANEIAEAASQMFGCRSETVRKRCHELVTAGLFIEGPPRACRVTGKQCTTYHLTRHL